MRSETGSARAAGAAGTAPAEGSAESLSVMCTRSPRGSATAMFRAHRTCSLRSARTMLPRRFVLLSAVVTHFAAFVPTRPRRIRRRPFLDRIAPFASAGASALVATALRLLFVSTHRSVLAAIIVVSRVARIASVFVTRPVGVWHSVATVRGSVTLEAAALFLSFSVGTVRHFICTHFASCLRSPLALGHELHGCRRQDSSKEHQRLIAHLYFLQLECRSIS
jgi:hypothetical protein